MTSCGASCLLAELRVARRSRSRSARRIQEFVFVSTPVGTSSRYVRSIGCSDHRISEASQAFGDGPFTIVETRIPTVAITPEMRAVVDRGISTVTVPTNALGLLSTPRVWNNTPVPK